MNGKAAVLIGSESDRAVVESSRQYYDYFGVCDTIILRHSPTAITFQKMIAACRIITRIMVC